MARRDLVLTSLPLNEEGKVDGFQFGGRARAIAEWRDRKEDKEFRRLCRRIYMNGYMRRRWIAKPEYRAWAIARNRAWKLAHKTPVRICLECGKQWKNLPGLCLGGRPPTKYCSKKCRVRFKNKELAAKRKGTDYWKKYKRPNRNRARNERNRLLREELQRRGIKIMRQIMCECGHGNWAHERAKGSEGRAGKPGRCTGGTGPCGCAKFRRSRPSGYHDDRRR